MNKNLPRLTAALKDRCLLTEGEAESAIRAVAAGDKFAGSEAVMHFGGAHACVRHAFRQRAFARRYSGNPIWDGWNTKPLPRQPSCPSWHDRVSQMQEVAKSIAGASNYTLFDLKQDCSTVFDLAADDAVFLWFVRENGTHIEPLALPRARKSVDCIVDMECWKAIFRIDLARGIVLLNRQQARHLAESVKPFRADSGLVWRPNGKLVAAYDFSSVPDRCGVYDATLRLENFEWTLSGNARPAISKAEFKLIERSVLHALIEKTQTLFTQIRRVSYRVNATAELDSSEFCDWYCGKPQSSNGVRFPRLWYRSGGERYYSPSLPAVTATEAQAWMSPFKAMIRTARGDLRGVRFGMD